MEHPITTAVCRTPTQCSCVTNSTNSSPPPSSLSLRPYFCYGRSYPTVYVPPSPGPSPSPCPVNLSSVEKGFLFPSVFRLRKAQRVSRRGLFDFSSSPSLPSVPLPVPSGPSEYSGHTGVQRKRQRVVVVGGGGIVDGKLIDAIRSGVHLGRK